MGLNEIRKTNILLLLISHYLKQVLNTQSFFFIQTMTDVQEFCLRWNNHQVKTAI